MFRLLLTVACLLAFGNCGAGSLAALCADRAAIERVYYNHRLGTKPAFEEVLPQSVLEGLVLKDGVKEAVLRDVYHIKITSELLDKEVQRINTTTRAPEILAEIKAVLGNDSDKFANAFAKPILVERLLREKFVNDDSLHAGTRRQCEEVRNKLLAAKTSGASPPELLALLKTSQSNAITETTWQLGARPGRADPPASDETEIKRQFGPDAQLLASASAVDADQKPYFEDLPSELQRILRVQLRGPGDVSAVIEMPGGFLLYLAEEKTPETLSVATLSLPKRSYEEWLNEQKVSP